MSKIAAFRSMRGRLVAAIHRHGLRRVAVILLSAMYRYGLVTTIRLGRRERPFPGDAIASANGLADFRLAGPVDLDTDYALDPKSWTRWEGLVGASPPARDPKDDDVESCFLTFVIAEGEDSAAFSRTQAAIARMGAHARIWSSEKTVEAEDRDGRFFVFVQAGDLPSPDMPRAFARAARRGVTEVISFDLCRQLGERVQPMLFPGANPTLLEATDYFFSRVALRGEALPAAIDPETASPREWVLKWVRERPAVQARGRWRHIGQPLIFAAILPDSISMQRRDVLERTTRALPSPALTAVSVVICTRDRGHLTRQLVRRLLSAGDWVDEIVIVSNGTANPYALQTLSDLAQSPKVRVLHRPEAFNFSRLSNAGARHARGRGPILFLNDDITPVSEDWLQHLVDRLADPDVGSVGPLLLYPDERVQHAGMYLGFMGAAGHTLRGARLPEEDYLFTAVAPREVTCLTGAVLLTPRAAFEALNGFDEQLATHLQDVDYCMRLRRIGLLNIFEPASVLIHMESASIRSIDGDHAFHHGRQAERQRFADRWGLLPLSDPLHPVGFDVNDETLRRLAGPNGARP